MYRLARFSVKYPTTIMMLVLAVILLGYIAFSRLGMDLLPDLNSPRLFVEIEAGERPPEEMEEQFVSQLEAVAARGRNVENVSSISRVGQALITVEYGWDTDMDEAFLDLQKSMADFSQNSDLDGLTVSQHDPNATPVIVAILSHPEITDLNQLRQTAENIIRNELIRLPGVAAVELVGAREREMEVRTDAYILEAYGLTLDGLANTIISSNRNMSGGSIVEMGRRYIIRGVAELTSEGDLNNLIVAYKSPAATGPTGEAGQHKRTPVYLREVADVSFVLSEAENIVRLNGKRCIALEVFKEARYNTIDASADTHEQLEVLRQSLPGYELEVIQDQARFIQSAITEVEQTGLIGIFLAVLVLFVFLRRIGVTAIISIAIPISVIGTFNLMYFHDLTVNIMTLGGLALGAGMLVDNAIVVVENIFRHLEEGKPLTEAAVLGAGEVGGAITSSTLTTIVVFLPIVYLHGAAGELFREQAWTVAFSLLSSLFVALAVIPMLCSQLLGRKAAQTPANTVAFPKYGRFLEKTLKRRGTVVLAGIALVAITIVLIPFVGSEFMPDADQQELYINITMPEGTNLERTEGAVRNLEAAIRQRYGSDIDRIYSRIGPAGASTEEMDALTDENNAVLHLVRKTDSRTSMAELVAGLDQELSELPDIDARLVLEQTALQTTLGTTSAPLVVEIKGEDLDVLSELADQVKEKVSEREGLTNTETSFQEGRPEVNVEIDHQGDYASIVLRRPDVSLAELEGILLESSSGRRVRLDEVARLTSGVSPREIIRNNQARIARVTAHLADDTPFDQIANSVSQSISDIALPAEYTLAITGEEKLRKEAFGDLNFALLLAIILVYMVMASQFESLLHPLVILLTIPLAGVGAVWLLLILSMPFNIMSFIGIIMLAGIAVNDSIILVDRINQNRRGGQNLDAAIVNAGRTRIRPIIITSITTILALLPLTIGIGEGASLRAPMALAVIGGLVTSTLLTLVVIPAVYHLLAGRAKVEVGSQE
jgi:HAE1 family hydrophobic/amphiphilic exporter-1